MNFDRVIAVRTSKTVYRDGDRCLKVFGEEYSKADVLNEALNQARVEETRINIPKILEVTMHEKKWVIVSQYISGKTLQRMMDEQPEKRDEYLQLFIDLQLRVLSEKCPMLNLLKDKMKRKISQADLTATERYDLHMRLDSMPRENSVCHGDFNPSNIIISDDGTPYILDWSHVTQGNMGADAARTYLLFWLNGNITGADKYLDLFCEKSGLPKQHIQSWMPIVAASQSVKGNEKDREFLHSWFSVVDYR